MLRGLCVLCYDALGRSPGGLMSSFREASVSRGYDPKDCSGIFRCVLLSVQKMRSFYVHMDAHIIIAKF